MGQMPKTAKRDMGLEQQQNLEVGLLSSPPARLEQSREFPKKFICSACVSLLSICFRCQVHWLNEKLEAHTRVVTVLVCQYYKSQYFLDQ